jgi:hypothetical protein
MLDVVQHEGRVQQYTSQPFVSLNTVVDARNISRSINAQMTRVSNDGLTREQFETLM